MMDCLQRVWRVQLDHGFGSASAAVSRGWAARSELAGLGWRDRGCFALAVRVRLVEETGKRVLPRVEHPFVEIILLIRPSPHIVSDGKVFGEFGVPAAVVDLVAHTL